MSARAKSSAPTFWAQDGANVRLTEGPDDLAALAPLAGTVVVIDVLSFSTCVSVAVAGGGTVLPLPWRDERAGRAAAGAGAVLAGPRSLTEPSLSPASLQALPAGTTLALPSPNGAGQIARLLRDRGLSLSAEARAGADLATGTDLAAAIRGCVSGRELIERGFTADVDCATELDADDRAALLVDGRLVGRRTVD